MKLGFTKLVVLITFIGLLPVSLQAQFPDRDVFFLSINPVAPSPGSQFSARVISSAFSVSDSDISWFVNGSLEKSGKGESFLSLRAPGVGESMSIRVSITTPRGVSVSKSSTIRPAGIDLIWETNTYTPPFYKGKALYSYRSPIKIVAVPRTTTSRSVSLQQRNDLNHEWSVNGERVLGASGFGKNSFEFIPKEVAPKGILVSVSISDLSGNLVGSNGVLISEITPRILFYEESPVLGKISKEVISGSYRLEKDEVLIKAEPFYFTSRELENGDLSFVWKLNNSSFLVEGDQTRVVFGKGSGISLIDLDIENPLRVIQKAFNQFRIINE